MFSLLDELRTQLLGVLDGLVPDKDVPVEREAKVAALKEGGVRLRVRAVVSVREPLQINTRARALRGTQR